MADLPYEELAHTADLCLRVRGNARAQLFAHAAEGLFMLMRWQSAPDAKAWEKTVHLAAPDAETLLVDWLAELLYLSESSGARLTAFDVQRATATELDATVRGLIGGFPERIIKAVTYHNLRIDQGSDGLWEAIVTLDV